MRGRGEAYGLESMNRPNALSSVSQGTLKGVWAPVMMSVTVQSVEDDMLLQFCAHLATWTRLKELAVHDLPETIQR